MRSPKRWPSSKAATGAVVTSSGMSAFTWSCQLLAADDLLIAPHDCYGGTYRLFSNLAKRGAVRVEFVDQTDDRAFAAALALRPKLVWIETPSNPLLRIVDIRALAQKAHAAGALLLVDNTFLSPVWQQSDRARRRSRAAFDDEVSERPQRRRRRRGDCSDAGAARAPRVVGELHRRRQARRSTAI